jgi:hypothetical protein
MTNVHDEVLELAAAAIDFDLSPAERSVLDGHLAECASCRRRIAAFEADQRAMFALPRLVPAPSTSAAIRVRVVRRQRLPRSMIRTLAIAAAVALLAVTALTLGAQIVRRLDRDLSDTTPTLAPDISADIEPALMTSGSTVDVIVTDLRVRTAPTVDDSKSAKLEPLLGRGTQLRILDGPVHADGYDWYQVEAIGWPHRGWVAAADHDGSPWIQLPIASRPPATLSAEEAKLIEGLRPDAAIDCRSRRTKLPARATVGVECHVNAAVVIRIGLYGFPTARDAATTYLERLASYGVDPRTGDCSARTEGDRAWQVGDGTVGPAVDRVSSEIAADLVVGRIGCFHDENGTANVRVVCGTTSVGLLGRDDDLADVDRWAWASPDGQPGGGEPPGICPKGT